MAGVLKDIQILDLSWGMAGPMAAMLLADQGAKVTRIEAPGGDPFSGELGYKVWNRGKRSAVLDLKDADDKAAFLKLVAKADVPDGTRIVPGSFREDTLPEDVDAISLVRVLYDHADGTVQGLLRKVYTALPPGGRLIVSEPMAGGDQPTRAGDAYFAIYTLAMQTGKTRSVQEVQSHLARAGFESIAHVRTHRPFVTSVVTATKPV